jgi:hypothetical protein
MRSKTEFKQVSMNSCRLFSMIKIILVKKSSQTAEKQSKGDKSDTHLACFHE